MTWQALLLLGGPELHTAVATSLLKDGSGCLLTPGQAAVTVAGLKALAAKLHAEGKSLRHILRSDKAQLGLIVAPNTSATAADVFIEAGAGENTVGITDSSKPPKTAQQLKYLETRRTYLQARSEERQYASLVSSVQEVCGQLLFSVKHHNRSKQ